ncbi:MAG: hypothetical protein LKI98_04285 [Bifidobacterium crudilactis]|jgi:hypothetical protein|nr:hypothetical protein [Bifidobacterium crudilactis]MCI1889639.1 hypothetical protein [Bifidobacterium crudilactis]
MTNHIEQAKEALSDTPYDRVREALQGELELAKAQALISIAEQLRIANLIALSNDTSYGAATVDAESALWQIDNNQLTHLQPDIAEALGIGGGSDD